MAASLKRRLYIVLEGGKTSDVASQVFDTVMVVLVLANVAASVVATLPDIEARYGATLEQFNLVSIVIFTVEYLARLWVSTEHPPLREAGPWKGRFLFALTPLMLIDLLVIVPFYISLVVPVDLRILRVFRLVRFLRLARFSPALATLAEVVASERRALLAALVVMMGMLLLASGAIYLAEGRAQPEAFGTIPHAMWWAVATLTTVGYGDIVPVTIPGRIIGGAVMLLGLAMFALPVGIIATGFAQQIHRREFIVEWGLLARVPLFSDLDAFSLAEIMKLLRSRIVPAGTTIFHAGEPADGLYFIALGEVELQFENGSIHLGEGESFGQNSLLKDTQRLVTAQAVTRSHLIFLDAKDFQILLARNPELSGRIEEAARQTLDRGSHVDAE